MPKKADLAAEVASLRLAVEYQRERLGYIEGKLPPCACGHDWMAHCGHAYSHRGSEPHHCSRGDGCADYEPGAGPSAATDKEG